jgi:predicted nucleic acid-binding protein
VREYVLDANAAIRYFTPEPNDPGAEKVDKLIEDAKNGRSRIWMSVVNLGEVFYILLRRLREDEALKYIDILQQAALIHTPDVDHTIAAARLKHGYKFGYADSFAAALAIEKDATLVSADPVFERLERKLKWMKLPRFRE